MKSVPRKDRNRRGKPGQSPAKSSGGAAHPKRRSTFPERLAPSNERRPRFPREVSVLYEDDAVIAIDKPAGLLSVPIKGSDVPSALSLLQEELKQKKQRALVVHRIDRFASGILLFAKTNSIRNELITQFLDHSPVREYLTVVRGRLTSESGTLVHYFKREGMFQQLRSADNPEATRAELRYSVERVFADASLVRVELVTGLQNQIRAQFAALGHPVIGDRKYSRAESSEQLIDRVALHAAHLEFVHPRSGEMVTIDCRPPADFQHLVRELAKPNRARR
jgi:23S rRNA pseudouridine1911/1915/1917 synthase